MDRRSLLRGATALAGIPILGRYVIDNPTVTVGADVVASSTPGLLLPEQGQLVIASALPARNVNGLSIWPIEYRVDSSTDDAMRIRLEGYVDDPADLHIMSQAFYSRRRLRIYVESESG